MSFLFLGWGKVTQALAQVCPGPKVALVEKDGPILETLEISSDGLKSSVKSSMPGTFETVDWNIYRDFQIILSPGIDPRRSFFKAVEAQEVRELDYFCGQFKGWIVGITGTDGKSTFTTQLGEVLRRSLPSQKVFVGGNLGEAMGLALKGDFDGAVLEISSFQAERLKSARLRVGILLNLSIDHADRYDSFEDYATQKWALLSRSDFYAAPSDLKPLKALRGAPLGPSFPNNSRLEEILKALAPEIFQKLRSSESQLWKPEYLQNLPTLPHRLEVWKTKDGVGIVNDSKATTVHASLYGYEEMKRRFERILLILGGKYKGDDFSPLAKAQRAQDTFLLIGQARFEIETQLRRAGSLQFRSYESLAQAVTQELPGLKVGDCLMLSPACSSYDEFKNFEHRGDQFKGWVQKLRGELAFS